MERKGIPFICALKVRVCGKKLRTMGFFGLFLVRRDTCDLSYVVKSSVGVLFKNTEGRWKTNWPSCKKLWKTMPSVGHVAGLAWSTWM